MHLVMSLPNNCVYANNVSNAAAICLNLIYIYGFQCCYIIIWKTIVDYRLWIPIYLFFVQFYVHFGKINCGCLLYDIFLLCRCRCLRLTACASILPIVQQLTFANSDFVVLSVLNSWIELKCISYVSLYGIFLKKLLLYSYIHRVIFKMRIVYNILPTKKTLTDEIQFDYYFHIEKLYKILYNVQKLTPNEYK